MQSREHSCHLLILLLGSVMMLFGCSSSNDSNAPVIEHRVSGRVVNVDMQGATIELYDPNGNLLASADNAVDASGAYSLSVVRDAISSADYYILKASYKGCELNTILTGYTGRADYSGDDAVISPHTDAAYLLCNLTKTFRITDYVAFLRVYENGVYDAADYQSRLFSFREVIQDVTDGVLDYFNGTSPSKPTTSQICSFIEEKSHVLSPIEPDQQMMLPFVRRALVSSDRGGFVFLSYGPEKSTISSQPLQVTSSSHVDGSFAWKTYNVNLAGNELENVRLETGEAKEIIRTAEASLASVSSDRLHSLSPARVALDAASNVVTVCSSNVADLVDPDNSGITSVSADHSSASVSLAFKETVVSESGKMEIRFPFASGSGSNVIKIPETGGQRIFTYEDLDLTLNQNTWFTVTLHPDGFPFTPSIYEICDVFDKTRYVTASSSSPMIAGKTMGETRADPTGSDFYNNYPASNDTQRPVVAGDTYTHYILDFDRIVGAESVVKSWADTEYGKKPPGDRGGRTPLLIIHGWQGNSKNAAVFGMWSNSPLNYFYNLIDYYLASETLRETHHLYFVRWSSYKHVPFNGLMLTEMLQDVIKNVPESDLARGLTDEETGVMVMTHSTGGIVFRSATETHQAFAGTTSDHGHLKGAILLASPNHGTPLAFYGGTQKLLTGLGIEYVDTQASADLELDSFDGRTSIGFLPVLGSTYVQNISIADDQKTRWDPSVQNCKAFDAHFQSLLPSGTKTFNPWLAWMNQAFEGRTDDLKSRYILYSGRISTSHTVAAIAAIQAGCDAYQTADNWGNYLMSFTYMADSGYFSDGVLPLGSNLFANAAESNAFNPTFDPFSDDAEGIQQFCWSAGPFVPAPKMLKIPASDWYPESTVFEVDYKYYSPQAMEELPVKIPSIVIGSPEDHPLGIPFRIVWSYSHNNIHCGANIIASPNNGEWDKYIAADDDLPASTKFSDLHSSYITNDIRNSYIESALTYKTGETPEPIGEGVMKNPLKYEPVYLLIEKDLTEFDSP